MGYLEQTKHLLLIAPSVVTQHVIEAGNVPGLYYNQALLSNLIAIKKL
jgi:hypothetical protein